MINHMHFKHRHKRSMRMPDVDMHFPYVMPDLMDQWYTSPIKRPGRIKANARIVSIPGYCPVADYETSLNTSIPAWNRCITLSKIFDIDRVTHESDERKDELNNDDRDCFSSPTPPVIEDRKIAPKSEIVEEEITATEEQAAEENVAKDVPEAIMSENPPSIDVDIIDAVCASFEIVSDKNECDPTLSSERGRDKEWVWV